MSFITEIFGKNSPNLRVQYVASHSYNADLTDDITWSNLDLTAKWSPIELANLNSIPSVTTQSGLLIMSNSNGIFPEFEVTFYIKTTADANAISTLITKSQNGLNEEAPYFNFIPDSTRSLAYKSILSVEMSNDGYKAKCTFKAVEKITSIPLAEANDNTYYYATGAAGLNGASLEGIVKIHESSNDNISITYTSSVEKLYLLSPTQRSKFDEILGASQLNILSAFLADDSTPLTTSKDPRIETVFGNTYYVYETVNLITVSATQYDFIRN